jgi:hypothetical protein
MRNRLMGGILGVLLLAALPAAAFAQLVIGVSVNTAPPPLPVYAQPASPGVGYLWTPGYWAWADGGYYWVPGTWVMAPQPGLLWTPGWWGWSGGAYVWHAGYWGPQVGFYGGVDYGFGYSGHSYDGGYWRGNRFYYNRSVNNISNTTNITNIYNAPPPPGGDNHVSYNGGQGGLSAQPTAAQRAYESAHHVGPTAAQSRHEQAASRNRQLRASVNHGKPAIAATAKPGEFSGKDVVAAIAAGGAVHAAATRSASSERQQQMAQVARRQQDEQQRTARAEQRQPAERPPSPIREAQAPAAHERPQAARGNEHEHAGEKPPARPKQEEKPQPRG